VDQGDSRLAAQLFGGVIGSEHGGRCLDSRERRLLFPIDVASEVEGEIGEADGAKEQRQLALLGDEDMVGGGATLEPA